MFGWKIPRCPPTLALAGSFAVTCWGCGRGPGRPVGCVWLVSAECLPTKIPFWLRGWLYGQKSSSASYSTCKRESSVDKRDMASHIFPIGDRGSGGTGTLRSSTAQLYGSHLLDPMFPSCLWGQSSHTSHPPAPGKSYTKIGVWYRLWYKVCFLKTATTNGTSSKGTYQGLKS